MPDMTQSTLAFRVVHALNAIGAFPIVWLTSSHARGLAGNWHIMDSFGHNQDLPNYNLRCNIGIALGVLWFGGMLALLIYAMPKGL